MSTPNKNRKHAAEAFLSRVGTPKDESMEIANANEQNSADADKQSFVLGGQQKTVDTNEQQTVIAIEHDSNDAGEQKDNNTEMQISKTADKMRRITFNIPESLFKQLKWLSVQEDITMLEIGAAMAREYIEKRK